MSILEVNNLEVSYGYIRAVKGISFNIEPGEIIALIGANGAGKTTTLHAISGILPLAGGNIIFDGVDLAKVPAHKRVAMGMAQVPEGRRIFQELTVMSNLVLGGYSRKSSAEVDETIDEVFRRFPRLKERRNQIAGTLSGGEQQMLAMGRALISKPKIMLLDEPSMGLSPILVSEIFDIIKSINESGTTVLLVEQNAKMALEIADRAYVLETGNVKLSGNAKELASDDSVRKAYLGEA